MDPDFITILAAVFTGGVGAKIAEVALTPWRLSVERRNTESASERSAHAGAAQEFVDKAARVYKIIEDIGWDALADDAGVYDTTGIHSPIQATTGAREAMLLLDDIWQHHPTPGVSAKAKALRSDIAGFYYNPPMNGREWPSYEDRDDLLAHQARAEELVELIRSALPAPARKVPRGRKQKAVEGG